MKATLTLDSVENNLLFSISTLQPKKTKCAEAAWIKPFNINRKKITQERQNKQHVTRDSENSQ